MTTAVAPERHFVVFARGEVREEILATWRTHLRTLTNPDTNAPFTETEIATATAQHSRYWIEGDAIDLVFLAKQSNGLWLADQVRHDRAGTAFLETYHGPLIGEVRLEATGGSGQAKHTAPNHTIFPGSTTIPDPAAVQYTAPDGKRYQNLFTVESTGFDPNFFATMTLKAIDTGTETNLAAGVKLTNAQNVPANATGQAEVLSLFRGGGPRESDREWAKRMSDQIRHKPASGNWSHFRTWARMSSNNVDDAFVYSCALHAGTTLVVPVVKRGATVGPLARIPDVSVLATVRAFLTPPGSPVVPAPPFVLVLPPVSQVVNMVLSLAMPTLSSGGWTDPTPWPNQSAGAPTTVTTVTDQTHFRITRPSGTAGLPTGVTAPGLMVYNDPISRFEKLNVASVTFVSGDNFDVVLSSAPTKTIAVGDYISPDNGQRSAIALSVERYFDSLGSGEVVNLASDVRAHRALRYVKPSEEAPQRAGDGVLNFLREQLGSQLGDQKLESAGVTPTVPSDPSFGPKLCTTGRLAAYKL